MLYIWETVGLHIKVNRGVIKCLCGFSSNAIFQVLILLQLLTFTSLLILHYCWIQADRIAKHFRASRTFLGINALGLVVLRINTSILHPLSSKMWNLFNCRAFLILCRHLIFIKGSSMSTIVFHESMFYSWATMPWLYHEVLLGTKCYHHRRNVGDAWYCKGFHSE